ncbi:protein-L-isoaspartate(D-aspartate) O-methyltransferase [Comamonas sediminis]|uniref:protein-L-isoaspartate(D-aspartate) O-methyltransferase n=1 Tax=Comamonas TaxID=283 RepID=UPI00359431AD
MTLRKPGFPARGALPVSTKPQASSVHRQWARLPAELSPVPMAVRESLGPESVDFTSARLRMVQRLAASGVEHIRVLKVMNSVLRHQFVDSALAVQAYEDTSLPIGLGQTISKPSVVARMCELLLQSPAGKMGLGRILEIGTGCGYQAAVLSLMAKEVYTIERLRALHEKARVNLRPLRLANVHLILGDGMLGFEKGAPYAGIIAAAGGDSVPQAWCDQLAEGGRLVAPVMGPGQQQVLLVVDRSADGFQRTVLEHVHFVPLKSGLG